MSATLRKKDCRCRGCRKPGKHPFVKRPFRKGQAAPTTHAEAMLGIEHGKLHDIAKLETAAYDRLRSPEVILHFGYNDDGTRPAKGIKCYSNPEWIIMRLM